MVVYFNPKDIFQSCLDVLYARIAEFEHLIAVCEDDMIVLLILESPLKQSGGLSELVFAHQITINEEVNRIIKCSPGNAILFVFHPQIQGLNIKMSFVIVDFPKNSKSLGGFPVFVNFEISGKYVSDFVLNLD